MAIERIVAPVVIDHVASRPFPAIYPGGRRRGSCATFETNVQGAVVGGSMIHPVLIRATRPPRPRCHSESVFLSRARALTASSCLMYKVRRFDGKKCRRQARE